MKHRIQRVVIVVLILAGMGAGACVEPPGVACGDAWCPEGYLCRMAGADDMGVPQWVCHAPDFCGHDKSCKDEREACGNGDLDKGEQCDFGPRSSNDGACLESCQIASCGDGWVWTNVEQCDDGNFTNGDGCSASCKIESCGNGILDVGEQCDFGPLNADSGVCLSSCRIAACGDGHVWAGVEQCDDGNPSNGDGCESNCVFTP